MLSAQIYFDPAYTQEFLATRDVLFRMLAIIAGEDHRMEFISRNILEHVRRVESLIRVDQTIAKVRTKETGKELYHHFFITKMYLHFFFLSYLTLLPHPHGVFLWMKL